MKKEMARLEYIKTIKTCCSHEDIHKFLESQRVMEVSRLFILLPKFIKCSKYYIKMCYNKPENDFFPIKYSSNIALLDYYVKSISSTLAGIHEYSLIHGNIKPNNILVDIKTNEIYVSDCFENDIRNYNILPVEQQVYLSPEQLYNKEITKYSDYWSFSCLLFYLINEGEDLFNPNELKKEMEVLKESKRKDEYIKCKLKTKGEDKSILKYVNMINKILSNKMTFKEISESISKPRKELFEYNCFKYSIDSNLIIPKEIYIKMSKNIDVYNEIFEEYIKTKKSNYLFCLFNFMWFNEKEFKSDEYQKKFPFELPVIDYDDYDDNDEEKNRMKTHKLKNNFLKRNGSNFELDYSNLDCNEDTFLLLLKNLRYTSYISYLDLSWNNFDVRCKECFRENFVYLKELKIFLCCDSRLGDDVVLFLSNYLVKMVEIDGSNRSSINFSDSEMTVDGFKSICNNLNKVTYINELFLQDNSLKTDGVKYFEQHCSLLTSLEKLHLSCINYILLYLNR